jgi:unsaturated chondroitin disaccharide hydrolase
MQIDEHLTPNALRPGCQQVFELAAAKSAMLAEHWKPELGAPVFTAKGRYTSRNWTQWTEGFMYGIPILVFDATDDQRMLEIGRTRIRAHMALHVTHHGVHDHGFNNLSTYGHLRRLMNGGRIQENAWEREFYELAIKASACAQAVRWSASDFGTGYIYSFNGPHSLFIDTMRTLRILSVAWQMNHNLQVENDRTISLLSRVIEHGLTTAKSNIYYGTGRDYYDTPENTGRTAHESVFNVSDGHYRCPSSQQGYSPFSTWTRGLAWAILGFAEELEFLASLPEGRITEPQRLQISMAINTFEKAAEATADFYIRQAAAFDGVCYWDTGAPGLVRLGDFRNRPAEPFNDYEPVDASASVIAAQGLLRLGRVFTGKANRLEKSKKYIQAGLTIARTLFSDTYLSTDSAHQGLLLHSVYHRPNGWDYIPLGRKVPCGESSMWGDYHLVELALYISRLCDGGPYYKFFD